MSGQMMAKNSQAVYVCINYEEAVCPEEIANRSFCINRDKKMLQKNQFSKGMIRCIMKVGKQHERLSRIKLKRQRFIL